MSLTTAVYRSYIHILEEELRTALGCTEPIAIAYAAAKAVQVLGELPKHVTVQACGNIIKNVKSVIVPNSGGMKGAAAAAAIGAVGGNPDLELEVLTQVRPEHIEQSKLLVEQGFCSLELLKTPAKLHLIVRAEKEERYALIEILHTHTNIVRIEKNGQILLETHEEAAGETGGFTDRSCLNVADILRFADTVDLSELPEGLNRQIEYNTQIAREGFARPYGANIGKGLLELYGDDIKNRAKALAASGSDARMSGCDLPVVINSGSGNQGMTVSLPVIAYAEELGADREKLLRALIVSNLVAIHQKTKIGRLSAYCGAVSAACGSGAGITYLYGGDEQAVGRTITNTLANVAGILCDGAKPSCAAKIASAVDAAITAHHMAMKGWVFDSGDGIVKDSVEKTIDSVGRIAAEGMQQTDTEILKVMLEQ